ncbi:MAG: threonine--tRNA ligase, partial [Pyramidobacter porci]|nr:threonine--tRNA ligase [Pyramidobacter porci]
MAQAVKRLYPDAHFAYGPATDEGFYYDIDIGDRTLSDEDLPAVEAEMQKIVGENLPFKVSSLLRTEAVRLMQERGEKYKAEHISDLPEDAVITFYQQGEYIDMCVGPHLTYTKALKSFKLTAVSGAYWKNNRENKMLTRLNGVAFRTKEELAEYERQAEEAKARDHRRIGKEMKLFMTDDLVGKGLPMFLPKGYAVW